MCKYCSLQKCGYIFSWKGYKQQKIGMGVFSHELKLKKLIKFKFDFKPVTFIIILNSLISQGAGHTGSF